MSITNMIKIAKLSKETYTNKQPKMQHEKWTLKARCVGSGTGEEVDGKK